MSLMCNSISCVCGPCVSIARMFRWSSVRRLRCVVFYAACSKGYLCVCSLGDVGQG